MSLRLIQGFIKHKDLLSKGVKNLDKARGQSNCKVKMQLGSGVLEDIIQRKKLTLAYTLSTANIHLLQLEVCMYFFACLCAQSLQLCPTLCDPLNYSCQAPLSMGFSRQVYWSRLLFPSPGNLPEPGIQPQFLAPPALAGGFFATNANWEAHSNGHIIIYHTRVLMSISSMTNDVQCLFMCLFTTCITSLVKFKCFAHRKNVFFSFVCFCFVCC